MIDNKARGLSVELEWQKKKRVRENYGKRPFFGDLRHLAVKTFLGAGSSALKSVSHLHDCYWGRGGKRERGIRREGGGHKERDHRKFHSGRRPERNDACEDRAHVQGKAVKDSGPRLETSCELLTLRTR